MAPWNEFVLAINLKQDTPQLVIDWLTFMTNTETENELENPETIPDHYFFKFEDWIQVFWDETLYFPGKAVSRFVKDDRTGQYSLTARAMIRSDEYLVAALMSWLAQYSETQGFIGYTRCDEIPDVIHHIHFYDGEAYYYTFIDWNGPPRIEKIKLTQEKGPYGDEIVDN